MCSSDLPVRGFRHRLVRHDFRGVHHLHNLIVAAVILVCALGFNSVGGVSFAIAGVTINLSGLAIAAIAGILLNAILPGNDYEFDAADGSEAASSSNLQV